MAVTARAQRGPRRRERLSLLFLAIAFVAAAAIATAGAATNSDGAVTITVTPTEGLADGQPVSIHAEATGGAQIFELRAHLCQTGAGIDNTSEFGFQGPYCPNAAIGAGQFDEGVIPPAGSTTADLQFAVGTGGITWLDEQGYVHELTCGPGHPCDLVVEAQITNDTAFVTFPLLIGEGMPPPPPPPSSDPPAAPPAAGTPSGASAATGTGTPSGGGADGAKGPAAGKLGASHAAAPGSSATRSSSGGDGSGGLGGVLSSLGNAVDAVATGDPQFSQSVRVIAGGVAGVIGGALVVLIIVRARRRMQVLA